MIDDISLPRSRFFFLFFFFYFFSLSLSLFVSLCLSLSISLSLPLSLPYNWVLYSPRGSASQCKRRSGQPDLHTGNMGTTACRSIERKDRVLQAASGRERTLRLGGESYQTEWHAIRVGRTEKVDRVSDLGIGRDQRRWRTSELSYLCQNSRGRYVSLTLSHIFSLSLSLSNVYSSTRFGGGVAFEKKFHRDFYLAPETFG